jgi:uncharacterized protein (TIGR00369 family)
MSELNPAYLDRLYAAVNESPFPHHLGFRLVSVWGAGARVELAIQRHHLQPFGIVHGGVISTLIDTATFWAAFGTIPADAGLVNVDLKLNYLEPAVSGTLVAEGTLVRPGRTVSYAEARVRTEAGALVAHGTSSLMTLPGKGLDLGVPKHLA